MYKVGSKDYLYAPTDLSIYLRSPFSYWMARLKLNNGAAVLGIHKYKDPILELLAKQGYSHEYALCDLSATF